MLLLGAIFHPPFNASQGKDGGRTDMIQSLMRSRRVRRGPRNSCNGSTIGGCQRFGLEQLNKSVGTWHRDGELQASTRHRRLTWSTEVQILCRWLDGDCLRRHRALRYTQEPINHCPKLSFSSGSFLSRTYRAVSPAESGAFSNPPNPPSVNQRFQ